jgi:hypothetical protein
MRDFALAPEVRIAQRRKKENAKRQLGSSSWINQRKSLSPVIAGLWVAR